MAKVYGSPFKIDWTDKEKVIAYAKRLGKGQTVFKDYARPTYGITHTSRVDLTSKDGRHIIYQT